MLVLLVPLLVVAALVLLIFAAIIRRAGFPRHSACIAYAAALFILAYVFYPDFKAHGPGSDGVLRSGFTPAGLRYALVQTYQDMFDPYESHFCRADSNGAWAVESFAEGSLFRNAEIVFDGDLAKIQPDGFGVYEIDMRQFLPRAHTRRTYETHWEIMCIMERDIKDARE